MLGWSLRSSFTALRTLSWQRLLLWLACFYFAGCHTPPPAPIVYRQPPPSEKIQVHEVSQNETLFSIAWRYEKDIQKLAQVNRLSYPYTIYSGQKLSLDTSKTPRAIEPKKSANPSSKPTAVASKPREPVVSNQNKPATTFSKQWRWQWPVQGNVTKRFNSSTLFKGINIQSFSGAPVVAAAPGVVVYSGSGLRGYGHLIIIKHSDIYLSAYAHNRKIYVKENAVVKAGQQISEVGGDPSDRKRFYFEIRKDGKPVDPQSYLPMH